MLGLLTEKRPRLLVTAISHQFMANRIVWTASDDNRLQVHFRRSAMLCDTSEKPPKRSWRRFLQLGYVVCSLATENRSWNEKWPDSTCHPAIKVQQSHCHQHHKKLAQHLSQSSLNIGWLQQATEFLRLFIAVSMRHRGVVQPNGIASPRNGHIQQPTLLS